MRADASVVVAREKPRRIARAPPIALQTAASWLLSPGILTDKAIGY